MGTTCIYKSGEYIQGECQGGDYPCDFMVYGEGAYNQDEENISGFELLIQLTQCCTTDQDMFFPYMILTLETLPNAIFFNAHFRNQKCFVEN